MSSGEIDINQFTHLEGVKVPDPGIPEWKATMIQDKNKKLIKKYLADQAEKQKEEDRWKAVPDWKKEIMLKHEKRKKQMEEEEKARLEVELKEREKFEKLPEWKKQIIMKKKQNSNQSIGSSKSDDVSEPAEETQASQTNGNHAEKIIEIKEANYEPVETNNVTLASDEEGDDNETPELDDVQM